MSVRERLFRFSDSRPRFLSGWGSGSSFESHLAIGGTTREDLPVPGTVWPADLDPVVRLCRKPDVDTRIVAGQKTAGGVEDPVVFLVATDDDQFCPVGVPACRGVGYDKPEPVARLVDLVAIQAGAATSGGDQQVDVAVIVDVAIDKRSARVGNATKVSSVGSPFGEVTGSGIEVHLVAVGVFAPVGRGVCDGGLA